MLDRQRPERQDKRQGIAINPNPHIGIRDVATNEECAGGIIYALICPVMRSPAYIGQSTVGITRPIQHIIGKSHSSAVNEWVNQLKSEGLLPIISVIDTAWNKEILCAKEMFWINFYTNKAHNLLNTQCTVTDNLDSIDSRSSDGTIMLSQYKKGRHVLDDVARHIKSRRMLLGLTQADLAEKAGTGLRFVRDVEQGVKKTFCFEKIIHLLNVVGRKNLVLSDVCLVENTNVATCEGRV